MSDGEIAIMFASTFEAQQSDMELVTDIIENQSLILDTIHELLIEKK